MSEGHWGLSGDLYTAGLDWLLTAEFGGELVTNKDGGFTPEQVRAAAGVIWEHEGEAGKPMPVMEGP